MSVSMVLLERVRIGMEGERIGTERKSVGVSER